MLKLPKWPLPFWCSDYNSFTLPYVLHAIPISAAMQLATCILRPQIETPSSFVLVLAERSKWSTPSGPVAVGCSA